MQPSGGLPYPLGNSAPSTLSPLARPFTVARAVARSNSSLAPVESAPPLPVGESSIDYLGEEHADRGWRSSIDIEPGETWNSVAGGSPWQEPSLDMHTSLFPGGSTAISQPTYVYSSAGHWPSSTSSCMVISGRNSVSTSDNDLKKAIPYGGYYETMAVDNVESPGCTEFRVNGSMCNEISKDKTGVRPRDSGKVSSLVDPSFGYEPSLYPTGGATQVPLTRFPGLWEEKYDNTSLGKHYTDLSHIDWLSGVPHSRFLGEKANNPSDIPSASFQNPSSLLGGLHFSESSVPVSGASDFNCSSSNSCYSRYIEQLDSCLTSQMSSCSYACSNISPGYDLSPRSVVPSECKNGPVLNFSKKPYSISYENKENQFLYNSKSSGICREDANAETSRVWGKDNYKGSCFDFSPAENDRSFSNSLPIESFREFNKVESRSTAVPHSSTSSTLERVSVEHISPVEGIFDQLNLAEDSPCWKGASASHLSPFTDCEILGTIDGSEDSKVCNNSSLNKQPFVGNNSESPFSVGVYSDVCFVANDKCGSPTFRGKAYVDSSSIGTPEKLSDYNVRSCVTGMIEKERSKCFSIPEAHQVVDGYNQENFESKCSVQKDINQDANHISIKCPALSTNLPDDVHKKVDPHSSSDLDICIETIQSGPTLPEVAVSHEINELSCSCEMLGKCSVHAKDVKHLVKAMHCLSEVILSTFSLDDSIMSKQDCDLLKLVIKNLEISMTRSKKDAAEVTSYISGPNTASVVKNQVDPISICEAKEATCDMKGMTLHTTNLKATGITVEQNRDKATNGYRGKAHHNSCSEVSCCNLSHESIGSDMRIPGVLSQALQEELKRRFLGFESPQSLPYKDLWIQAEASLCSLKYELQLLRMEQHLFPRKHVEEANTLLGSDMVLSNLRELCADVSYRMEDAVRCGYAEHNEVVSYRMEDAVPCGHAKHNEESVSKNFTADESEASVMDRFRILKGRMDNSLSTVIDNVSYFSLNKHLETTEAMLATNTCSEYPADFSSRGSNQKFGCDVITCQIDPGEGCVPWIKSAQYGNNAGLSLGISKQMPAKALDTYKPFVPLLSVDTDLKQFAIGRSGSSSSEWEHVHREEINW